MSGPSRVPPPLPGRFRRFCRHHKPILKTIKQRRRTTMTTPGEDLVELYDQAPLNPRYWISMALAITTSVFDFFDFFIVGFLVAVLAPQWHLTFGQTSVMLLSAGVGAIIGTLLRGALAARIGRKRLL